MRKQNYMIGHLTSPPVSDSARTILALIFLGYTISAMNDGLRFRSFEQQIGSCSYLNESHK